MKNPKTSPTVSFVSTEIVLDPSSGFTLHCSPDISREDVSLVIDLYDLDNPVHPEGHIGWWQFPVAGLSERQSGKVSLKRGKLGVTINRVASNDSWQNDTPVDFKRLLVVAVLRSNITNGIVYMDRIPGFLSHEDVAAFRADVPRDWSQPTLATLPFVLPSDVTVRIVSRNIFVRDAVGSLCLDVYRLLKQNDVPVELYAEAFDLGLNDVVHRFEQLFEDVRPRDKVFYFSSTYDPDLQRILGLRVASKIAYFHGITEPKNLQVFDPELSMVCERALRQIHMLNRFDVLAANSTFNAQRLVNSFKREMERVAQQREEGPEASDTNDEPEQVEVPTWSVDDIKVIPPTLVGSLPARREPRGVTPSGARLLYVGRIKSHKKIEDLLEFLAEYRKLDAQAELLIVGQGADKAYQDYLEWVQFKQWALPEERVHWLGSVSAERLAQLYESASAYVSMSEDEGFCLPIFEAMAAGLPTFAYGLPAVIEVMGHAGVYFEQKNFAHLAKTVHRLLNDEQRLRTLVDDQYARAGALGKVMNGQGFLRLLEPRS